MAELFGDALRSAARGGQLHAIFKGEEFLPRAMQLRILVTSSASSRNGFPPKHNNFCGCSYVAGDEFRQLVFSYLLHATHLPEQLWQVGGVEEVGSLRGWGILPARLSNKAHTATHVPLCLPTSPISQSDWKIVGTFSNIHENFHLYGRGHPTCTTG